MMTALYLISFFIGWVFWLIIESFLRSVQYTNEKTKLPRKKMLEAIKGKLKDLAGALVLLVISIKIQKQSEEGEED